MKWYFSPLQIPSVYDMLLLVKQKVVISVEINQQLKIYDDFRSEYEQLKQQNGQMSGIGVTVVKSEVEIDGDLLHVTVGAVLHPMTEPHHIAWIYVQYENGGQLVYLDHEGEPKATVALGGNKPVAVYEYCNLHGLWKTEL